MFTKVKLNHLVITFVVLLAIVLITIPGGNARKNRSFKQELTRFDSSAVTSLEILPKSGNELISLQKKDGNWLVSKGNASHNADNRQVSNMLTTLQELNAKRLAANDRERWDEFEVTDSLGSRVRVLKGDKTVADLYVGKFSYTQPSGQAANPYMRQQRGTMTSFVRLEGEKEVYAVDGFLTMMFNRSVNDFRDATVNRVQKADIARIHVQSPEETYTLVSRDSLWMLDGLVADSASAARYVAGISRLSSRNFLEEDHPLVSGTPTHSVVFENSGGAQLSSVDLYVADSSRIAVTSTQNPGTVFDGAASGLFDKLIKPREYFLGE